MLTPVTAILIALAILMPPLAFLDRALRNVARGGWRLRQQLLALALALGIAGFGFNLVYVASQMRGWFAGGLVVDANFWAAIMVAWAAFCARPFLRLRRRGAMEHRQR